MTTASEQGEEAGVLLRKLEAAISVARQQPGGFFPCSIAATGMLPISGSVQPLANAGYDRDAGIMCANIVADMEIDPRLMAE